MNEHAWWKRWTLLAAISLMTAACGTGFHMATPPGFVELPDQEPDYSFRATNPDGVVIALRKIEHEPKADMGFWVKAITNELRERGGYALLATKDVKNRQGLAGKRMIFGHDEDGAEYRYEIVLFVTDDYLYLIEFGGPASEMDKQGPRLDWVVDNFQLT